MLTSSLVAVWGKSVAVQQIGAPARPLTRVAAHSLQGLDEEPRAQPLALNLGPFEGGAGRRGLRRNSFGSATLGSLRKAARFSPQELAAQRWLESLAVGPHLPPGVNLTQGNLPPSSLKKLLDLALQRLTAEPPHCKTLHKAESSNGDTVGC